MIGVSDDLRRWSITFPSSPCIFRTRAGGQKCQMRPQIQLNQEMTFVCSSETQEKYNKINVKMTDVWDSLTPWRPGWGANNRFHLVLHSPNLMTSQLVWANCSPACDVTNTENEAEVLCQLEAKSCWYDVTSTYVDSWRFHVPVLSYTFVFINSNSTRRK